MICKNCEHYKRYEQRASKGSAMGFCQKKLDRYLAEYGELTGIKRRWPEVALNSKCTEVKC